MLSAMRFLIFLCGISIVAIGMAALKGLERADGFGLLQGALALGGGLIIAGFFSIRWFWHGVMGAGVLALLGFGRGLINLPSFFNYVSQFREGMVETPRPALETAVTIICLFLLIAVMRTLSAEKQRRLLEEGEENEEA